MHWYLFSKNESLDFYYVCEDFLRVDHLPSLAMTVDRLFLANKSHFMLYLMVG